MIMIINASQHCNSCMRIRGSSPSHLFWSAGGWERSRQKQCLLNLSTANLTKKVQFQSGFGGELSFWGKCFN